MSKATSASLSLNEGSCGEGRTWVEPTRKRMQGMISAQADIGGLEALSTAGSRGTRVCADSASQRRETMPRQQGGKP